MKDCCDMKGFLSFLVLRLIAKGHASGTELADEIEKRKGSRPSPGTIYPVLKNLSNSGWITCLCEKSKEKKYKLTPDGKRALKSATKRFITMFCDMHEEFGKVK